MRQDPTGQPPLTSNQNKLGEVIVYFLRLGLTAFGGPAAHIALMHHEAVERRHWLDEQRFLDLLAAANLIPGPSSTEMAIYLGYLRAGWPGLIAGGVCFILPAMLIVLLLAWGYQLGQSMAFMVWLMSGVKPVVIAIVFQALWTLGRKVIKGPATALAGAVVIALYLLGVNVIILLLGTGLVLLLVQVVKTREKTGKLPALLPMLTAPTTLLSSLLAASPSLVNLPLLFLEFLKIGAILFGSGYVLLAFLHTDFVTHLGWLTDRQLLDAIAIGQVTPGPVFTTATFIGYLLGGIPGALLSTLAIFLPAFVYVAISGPLIPRIRQSRLASSFLDGVTIASLGLMAGVIIQLSLTSLADPVSILICALAIILIFRFKTNPTWIVVGGAIFGVVRGLLLP